MLCFSYLRCCGELYKNEYYCLLEVFIGVFSRTLSIYLPKEVPVFVIISDYLTLPSNSFVPRLQQVILTSELIVAGHGSCSVITIGVKRTLVIDVPLQDWLRPCNVQGAFRFGWVIQENCKNC